MHFSSFLQTLSLLSLLSGSPAAAQAPGVDPASVNQECNHQGLVTIISPVSVPQTFAINQTVLITWTFENTTSSLFNIGIGDSSSGNFATFACKSRAVEEDILRSTLTEDRQYPSQHHTRRIDNLQLHDSFDNRRSHTCNR